MSIRNGPDYVMSLRLRHLESLTCVRMSASWPMRAQQVTTSVFLVLSDCFFVKISLSVAVQTIFHPQWRNTSPKKKKIEGI